MQSIAALVMLAAVFVLGCSRKPANTAAETPQKTFATPAEASQALHAAVQTKDDKALTQVLGAKGQKLISSGDQAEDKSAADSFAKKYDQMNRLVAMTDGSLVLYVGADNYPFPVPWPRTARRDGTLTPPPETRNCAHGGSEAMNSPPSMHSG